jgi:EAL domain-containing protein (putative c-di-GMP-specific phosphodiesterase class I)/GGDEF domain-containing protein
MRKQNYIKKFLMFSLVMTIGAITIYSLFLFNRAKFDVAVVSKENFESKMEEKLTFQKDFFDEYKNYTKALQYIALPYLEETLSPEMTENLFSKAIQGLENITQIRVMDRDFNEIIKVSKNMRDKNISIWTAKEKINKRHRDYFQYFKDIEKSEVGVSFMDNNVEFGKVEPEPVIRFAHKIFNESKFMGWIIVNVHLQKFIRNFTKTTLYDLWIIDKYGDLIVNGSDQEHHILGQIDISKYKNLKEIYPYDPKKLGQDYYFINDHTVISRINGLNPDQGLHIVLHTKYGHHLLNNWEDLIVVVIAIMFLSGLVISYIYGSHINNINEKYINSLFYDQKSGLPNKAKLVNSYSKGFSDLLVLVRLDNIKQIVSVLGLDDTDNLITNFSHKLSKFLVEHEIAQLYRVDNQSFIFVYPKRYGLYRLGSIIDLLDEIFTDEEFNCGDDCTIFLSLIFGVSDQSVTESKSIKDSLLEVNLALQDAKENNLKMAIFSCKNKIKDGNSKALFWIKTIKRSLKNNYVIPYAQAIIDRDGNIEKYETLIRIDYEGQVYTPFHFLDIAKDNRHYIPLSKLMIANVFKEMSKNSFHFSINLSTYDVLDSHFLDFIIKLIDEYKIADRLTIEILESEYTTQVVKLKDFIIKMKSYGVKFAIDDFGAGHSNFERLLIISEYLDYLKIDGSLIKNILYDRNSQILVRNIINFSNELGVKVIAEFVENKYIFEYLKDIGIDYFQGYYFHEPESIKHLPKSLN